MKLAERKRLIDESPFRDVDFLEERKQRRRPHILTFEEEDRVLAAAAPHIRALAVLILETGMRSRRVERACTPAHQADPHIWRGDKKPHHARSLP